MRKQNRIQFFHAFSEHLQPEIGCGIYYNGCGITFNKYAAAQTIVATILRTTNRAGAGNHRHTTAGSGTQESNF